MATARQEINAPRNPFVDISQILANVGPLLGSKGTTTETTSTPVSGLQVGLANLAASNANPDTDAVIQNIIRRAMEFQVPSILQAQLQSGGYNNPTTALLVNDIVARTTAEAAKTSADIKNQALQTAVQAGGVAAQGNKTATTSQVKASPIQGLLNAAGVTTAGLQVRKLLKEKFPDEAGKTAERTIGVDEFLNNSVSGVGGASSDVSQAFNFADNGIPGVTTLVPEVAIPQVPNVLGVPVDSSGTTVAADGSLVPVDASALTDFGGLGANDAAKAAFAGDAASGAGINEAAKSFFVSDAEGATAVEAGLETGAVVAGADVIGAGAVAAEGGSIWGGIIDVASELAPAASVVICTELMAQGKLDKKLWESSKWYRGEINHLVKLGYHFWGIPYVNWMKKSQKASNFIAPWATGRYQYIAGKFNWRGWTTVWIGEPACWCIGFVVWHVKALKALNRYRRAV